MSDDVYHTIGSKRNVEERTFPAPKQLNIRCECKQAFTSKKKLVLHMRDTGHVSMNYLENLQRQGTLQN
jgi:hypothetical protein